MDTFEESGTSEAFGTDRPGRKLRSFGVALSTVNMPGADFKNDKDTFYTVEYYHQNIDNNDSSLIHSDILMGTTDTLATAKTLYYG